jgi:Mrp family chromosome partitioning ATPase
MTRIFEALKKAQARSAALPFPPAETAPVRPLGMTRAPAVETGPLPRLETLAAAPLSEEVVRELTALRISLEAALEGRKTRVVMFLGSVSGEGASTVAYQFATLLATDGRGRALLLDVNPHTPGNGTARPGAGAVRPATASGTQPGARVANPLAVAVLADDPRHAARSPAAVRSLLAAMSGQFDWVIVDGPPVLEAPESADLAPLVDGAVIVVRSGHTKRPVALRAADLLRKSGVRILGSVLNRRRLEIPDFIYRRI